ncbi:MAG: hypothetical protein H7A05_00670 [Pseudomonadales bacterium]|nr:hypothetical protein [Pseudomonadales bacterium]MCP5329985.1 hypothetical protein [Pseudomonadales bacterium]MCP5343107.1 hypothetical protein [Pseudomonadales bacterium]
MTTLYSHAVRLGAAVTLAACATLLPLSSQAQSAGIPRTVDGKPDFNGLWQSIGNHDWGIEPHNARMSPDYRWAAAGATPAGSGIVEGDHIPYTAAARATQQENQDNWLSRDPTVKCYMPGVPRANYMPFPFHIVQSPEHMIMAYEFASANRIVYMNRPDFEAPVPSWMGHSLGHWEGDTLVIDVTEQMPDSWLDRSGNFHTEQLKVTERYTMISPNVIQYEATLTDPGVYTRPWKLSVPLYRRLDANAQLLEFKCVEFAEELLYGHLVKGATRDAP